MEWLVNNWYLVVAAIAVVVFVVIAIMKFFKLPTDQQIANLKEWLKWAVTEAEKELGSGTGQMKLRLVYGWAIDKFPWLGKVISFDMFSTWVDEALEWMKQQLDDNKAIKAFVTPTVQKSVTKKYTPKKPAQNKPKVEQQ